MPRPVLRWLPAAAIRLLRKRRPEMNGPLVTARDLTVRFRAGDSTIHAVNGVDFDLQPREVLCILGESGSGKSVTLRALMRLNRRQARRCPERCWSAA